MRTTPFLTVFFAGILAVTATGLFWADSRPDVSRPALDVGSPGDAVALGGHGAFVVSDRGASERPDGMPGDADTAGCLDTVDQRGVTGIAAIPIGRRGGIVTRLHRSAAVLVVG